MKERTTFLHSADDVLDLEQFELSPNSLQVKSLRAAREERLTFSLEDLPHEIVQVLQKCQQLHVRWVSEAPYPSIIPFLSRLPAGLHIFFTPQSHHSVNLLHPLFLELFGKGTHCSSHPCKFISTPTVTSRFASSSALQCYEVLPSLAGLVTYVQQKICPTADTRCFKRASRLQQADYLDVDYDAISRNLILTLFHHKPPESEEWDEQIQFHKNSSTTEVGVLSPKQAIEREELSLEGFLTVVGQDSKPNPTRFSFPSRHHSVPLTSGSIFLASFSSPAGLHPTLHLTFPSSISLPAPACALHTYLNLPSSLFVDKYQLSSPNFLASKSLRAIHALSGETDLEAPDWVIREWGSALLLELAPPSLNQHGSQKLGNTTWHADIPLHLRYLSPTAGGTSDIEVPWPVVFWACPADEGTKMNVNPFDRVNLGYESLFGPRTMFYHLQPQPAVKEARLIETVQVPVMDLQGTRWVESGTIGVVVLGTLWVVWKLMRILWRDWRSSDVAVVEKKMQ